MAESVHGLSDLQSFFLLSMAVNFIKPFVSWDLETGRTLIRLACHFHTFKFDVFPTLQMEN